MTKPITLADHQASRYVVEPLRLLDCCLVSNGGVAVIVTSAERARDLKQKPAYVLGMGQGSGTDLIAAWTRAHAATLDRAQRLLADLAETKQADLAMLSVALRELRNAGATVFMVTHQRNLLAAADRVLVMKDGEIAQLAPVAALAATPPRAAAAAEART